jgi:putative glutamine amidotransferase
MKRPLIGITSATSATDSSANNPQDRLNSAYSRAIEAAGGLPVILPNLDSDRALDAYLDRIDGLLLSGGADVDPCHFREPVLNESVEIDSVRDAVELPLIREAVDRDVPILAICRGIQSLNIALGGTLYQDIPAQIPSQIEHKQKVPRPEATHTIEVESGSLLAKVTVETAFSVNSFHHQALKEVASGLTIVARAPDGVIEGVENRDATFLLGVQFHPEELVGWSEPSRRLFKAFVEASDRNCGNGKQ